MHQDLGVNGCITFLGKTNNYNEVMLVNYKILKAKILVICLLFFSNIIIGQNDSISQRIISNINPHSEAPVHSILLYLENENSGVIYNEGFGTASKLGHAVTKLSAFKIASSTKLFVSTIILQLEEEGKLSINDTISNYLDAIDYLDFNNLHILNGIKHAQEITIEQLLAHRSGLADIFTDREDEFFELLFQNPDKNYTPESIIELYYQFNLNKEPKFIPGQGWHYSDINYLLLGLIIEQLDTSKLAQSIRNRILQPLEMKHTFFEYYENPIAKLDKIHQYFGAINFSKLNTSFDWAGGGLVSTNSDLVLFIKALFNYKLINKESLAKMIDVKSTKDNESRYGLGVYEFNLNGNIYYGHFGFYNTFIGYCPASKLVLSYSISQANPDFNTYGFISELSTLFANKQ